MFEIKLKLLFLFILLAPLSANESGAYDNGTAAGKGKLNLDFTLNPLNIISYGQSYAVVSYGLTDKFDIHGYFSKHTGNYSTWYAGLFYQFFKRKKVDLATAIGIRKRFNKKWNHYFLPQLLYTYRINEKFFWGGSIVNVIQEKQINDSKVALDIGLFYNFKYQSKRIENISFGFSAFHPATWKPKTYFLPTYSINIKIR